jgi:uncharacterized repeat protein (TIGR01451 family)
MLTPRCPVAAAAIAAAMIASAAQADCPAANRYSFAFTTLSAQTLSYAGTYNVTATNGAGQSQVVTLSFVTNGLSSSLVSGTQMPEISTFINDGGTTTRNLVIGGVFTGRTIDVNAAARVVVTRFTLGIPVRDFTVQVNDVDFTADQFRDWIQINGTAGANTYTPIITTPHGTTNANGGPRSAAASSQVLGPTSTPLVLSAQQTGGTGPSTNNSNTGTFSARFDQPVTELQVRYGNYPLSAGETVTGQQAIGIQTISFCPMPQVTVIKTSTPLSSSLADPKRFSAPGSDIIYAVTVSNSNSSPIDLDALIMTDILPPQLTFRAADFDDGGPLSTSFEFLSGTSGLTMSASDLTFSNTSGASFGYTPVPGYDSAVNAVRFSPKGKMAAGSSMTVRFRARIN